LNTNVAIFDILTAVKMIMLFFRVVTPCGIVVATFRPEDGDSMFLGKVGFTYKAARRHNPKEKHRCSRVTPLDPVQSYLNSVHIFVPDTTYLRFIIFYA
jgi:hypothetical protein